MGVALQEEKDDKVEQLKRAIEAAHRDAEKSKQMLKYQKLQRGGHDISALVQTGWYMRVYSCVS